MIFNSLIFAVFFSIVLIRHGMPFSWRTKKIPPPSAPDLRVIEDKHLPRAKGWDALLTYTHTKGIHNDDLPAAQDLTLPESSHLTRACATVFTDAYVRSLSDQTALLHLIPNSAPRLSTRNCVQPSVASLN